MNRFFLFLALCSFALVLTFSSCSDDDGNAVQEFDAKDISKSREEKTIYSRIQIILPLLSIADQILLDYSITLSQMNILFLPILHLLKQQTLLLYLHQKQVILEK